MKDQPYSDPVAYGNGPDDSVTDATERAAVTHHVLRLNGRTLAYTARAGHLTAVDASSSRPSAKIFYVAFTLDGDPAHERSVTFFYKEHDMTRKNTICLWYDGAALDAARFYARTFPDSAVGSIVRNGGQESVRGA